MIIAKRLPCTAWVRLADPLLPIIIFLFLLVPLFIESLHFGRPESPWRRWPGGSFQLADAAMFLLVVHVAHSMARMRPFSKRLLYRLAVPGAFIFLLLLQRDFGTAYILAVLVLILFVVGGASRPLLLLLPVLYVAAAGALLRIFWSSYAFARFLRFINPWRESHGMGYGVIDPSSIFRSAGFLGTGLGTHKLPFSSYSNTDYALIVVAEDLGLLGAIVILALFAVLITRGIQVARNAQDLYSKYLALGVSCLIGLQVLANLGVAMCYLRLTPTALPLISYGGSSVMITLLCVGILLGISSGRGSGALSSL